MIFYDFEVLPGLWLVVLADADTKAFTTILNNKAELHKFYENHKNDIWVGYNSRNYDQFILKSILQDFDPYEVSKFIIDQGRKGWEYSNAFSKIQLFNYDVMTSFHGLKQLEGFMGNDIRESSVAFDTVGMPSKEQLDELVAYCAHDVSQTIEVFCNRIEEFNSQMSLVKAFKLPLECISKTKPQLSAVILGAIRQKDKKDEFNISMPETLRIAKYKHIREWYENPLNRDYEKELVTDVAGVLHTFAWGGLHGAINKYNGEGIFISCDVASLYPALMIEYNYLSRNVSEPELFRSIRDTRLKLKAEKSLMQAPYKIVLNSTYGAMKDQYNSLYDPLMANNVCIAGQLLLLDLIEKLEPFGQLIQSNTDGVIFKVDSQHRIEQMKQTAGEWEKRTRLKLEWECFNRIYQKDVNNYITIHNDGSYKSKGAYVKELNDLDNDLPIVNKALVAYFINGIPVEKTIRSCKELKMFQKISKVSNKYACAMHGDKVLREKVLRTFASRSRSDAGVFKVKLNGAKAKIENTPERCFIQNNNINDMPIPRRLDVDWYIGVAKKRLGDFIV